MRDTVTRLGAVMLTARLLQSVFFFPNFLIEIKRGKQMLPLFCASAARGGHAGHWKAERWKLIYASVLAEDAQEATSRKQNVMVDGAT